MERTEILSKIQEILADVIDKDDLALNEASSPSTVEGWDSLAHFNLIMELQDEFCIKFGAAEIQSWKVVGDIINSVISKL